MIRTWTIPRIWDNDDCIIIGGGPSVNFIDLECLRHKRVLAVNCAYRKTLWADVMFFGDPGWHKAYGQKLNEFGGLVVTRQIECRDMPGIRVVRFTDARFGISTQRDLLIWNKSSGACAINLAYLLGAGRIILVGFDMKVVNGEANYHKLYPRKCNARAKVDNRWKRFLEPFPAIKKDLDALAVPCLNATPDSALTAFPMVKLEDVL